MPAFEIPSIAMAEVGESADCRMGSLFPIVQRCCLCGSQKMLKVIDDKVKAHIWNGAKWQIITHGRKRCKDCSASHRLSYVWLGGAKKCIMQPPDETHLHQCDPIALLDNNIGLMWSYMRQLRIRVFRGAVSLQAEACTILMTWPDIAPLGENKWRGC